ncbi:MAG: threonine synthase [Thermoprotei archaeon]|nr:MAG: threonine synthase [Thermoprotei archaeon]
MSFHYNIWNVVKKGVYLRCINCGKEFEPQPYLFKCPKCGSLLEVIVPKPHLDWEKLSGRKPGVWKYRELLPIREDIEPVSLGEGGTPLVPLKRVVLRDTGRDYRIYAKFEGANPTGSFKDRGMTIGITLAKYLGFKGVIVASTGNTSASAAAYAARAGLECLVVLPRGKVARGKLFQAILHGARIVEVEGSFDNALEYVMEKIFGSSEHSYYPLNSLNPWRLEGQKTIAYEIVDELGRVPDYVVVPVGNAGNISAIWKGFKELYMFGYIDKLPRMIGVQAEGASPLANMWENKAEKPLFVDKPETIATAIRIGKPINWMKAVRAVIESNGMFLKVSDKEIIEALRKIARYEGIGVEPASATAYAGFLKLVEKETISIDEIGVLVLTGHALKDPDTISSL